MTPAEWTAIGGVIAALVGAVSVALYRRRRTQIRGWVLLVGELQDRVDRLHAAVEAAEARLPRRSSGPRPLAQARDAQSQATRLGVLHDVPVAHVRRWEWIGKQVTPPAPSIPTRGPHRRFLSGSPMTRPRSSPGYVVSPRDFPLGLADYARGRADLHGVWCDAANRIDEVHRRLGDE